MKRTLIVIACATSVAGCASAPSGSANSAHGFETALTGLGHLVLSPLMVVAGLLEGIAALPVLLAGGVHELNQQLVAANAHMSLDETYRGAYGQPLAQVPASGDTGQVFHEMRSATVHFQSMLSRQGVDDANRYVLTAIRTADRDGYTLYAVVRRPVEHVRVPDSRDPRQGRTLNPVDLDYYRPYSHDVSGRPFDQVVDWAGLPRNLITTQKGQAILMNLAANSILNGKRSSAYWDVQQRWIAGEHRTIAELRHNELRARMGLG